MDSYKKDNPENQKNKPAAPGGPAADAMREAQKKATTTNLQDSFRSSGTGQLGSGRLAKTGKVGGTGAIDADRALDAMKTEVENGELLVSKLEGRIAVMIRATRITEKPQDVAAICKGISAGEANFTKQVATMLQNDPHTKRRVQVALYQWDQALKGLSMAAGAMQTAMQYEGMARAQYVESQVQVEKLRGQLYPLMNLHLVFRDNQLLSQLIPTPKVVDEPLLPPLPPPRSVPPAEAPGAATGSLLSQELAADPHVQEIVSHLKAATGNLRNRLIGMLGGVPREEDKK